MASVDQIEVRVPADRRLARVVRAAVSHVARGAGIPAGRASVFAGEVARRFTGLAARGPERDEEVALTLEPAAGGVDVRIRQGPRHGTVLRVRKERGRGGGRRRTSTRRRAVARRA